MGFPMVFLIGGLEESELFTDFTESAFYSPEGLEAMAPVFDKAPELPSPLGQVLVMGRWGRVMGYDG